MPLLDAVTDHDTDGDAPTTSATPWMDAPGARG
jgi:hypothetical protein